MYKVSTCPLGTIGKLDDVITLPGIMPRVHFTTSWDPSRECFDLMEEAAAGIHGIDLVILSSNEGSTFALAVMPEVDTNTVPDMWTKAFIGKLNMMDVDELKNLRGGIQRHNPAENMAEYADSGSGVNSKGDDF